MAHYRISIAAVDRAFAASDKQFWNNCRRRTDAEIWYTKVVETQIGNIDCQPTRVSFFIKGDDDGQWHQLSSRVMVQMPQLRRREEEQS